MSIEIEPLVFATQGGELSYHAQAVRSFLGDTPVRFVGLDTFGEVVVTTRNETNLGAIAICTVAGTVEDSARQIVVQRPSALPSVVGRQDIEVKLALIGSTEQTLEELRRPGVKCLGQMAALLQCDSFFTEFLPQVKRSKGQYRKESIKAVLEALERNDPNWIAVGPNFAAEALGGFVLGAEVVEQINPPNSFTSFYILQQETERHVLPEHPDRTEPRAVVSLAHPQGKGEFAKCMQLATSLGIKISRFIPFNIGDFTKHDKDVRRGGGILELAHTRNSGIVAEFSARVAGLHDNSGFGGPFNIRNLGGFKWYPEPGVDPMSLVPDDCEIPENSFNFDRFWHDLKLLDVKLEQAFRLANRQELERTLQIFESMVETRDNAAFEIVLDKLDPMRGTEE